MKNKNSAYCSSGDAPVSAKPHCENSENLLVKRGFSSLEPIEYDTELYRGLRLWACCREGSKVIDAEIVAVFTSRTRALEMCKQHGFHLVRFDSMPY